jgi:hypothetical protein
MPPFVSKKEDSEVAHRRCFEQGARAPDILEGHHQRCSEHPRCDYGQSLLGSGCPASAATSASAPHL